MRYLLETVLFVGVATGGWMLAAPKAEVAATGPLAAASGTARTFGFCHGGGGTDCAVDGDTFWMQGTKIRVADIDAPETHPARCAEEQRLGDAATRRLQALLNAGPIRLEIGERATDRYGRALRIVTRGGQSLGAQLVSEGLARRWTGRRQPWCPEAA